jgi:hypothetical protein
MVLAAGVAETEATRRVLERYSIKDQFRFAASEAAPAGNP